MTPSAATIGEGIEVVPGIERQAGVLAWLPNVRPVRIALVTSRRTGRWVFPKGNIDAGMTGAEAAAQEALEEAGLVGTPEHEPFGSFRTIKLRPPQAWTIEVDLYPMRIDGICDTWDEAGFRSRRLVTLDEARKLLDQPEMIDLAERFVASLGAG